MRLCRGKLPLGEPVIDNYDAFATLALAPKEVLRLLQVCICGLCVVWLPSAAQPVSRPRRARPRLSRG